jgi:hypothetical protein
MRFLLAANAPTLNGAEYPIMALLDVAYSVETAETACRGAGALSWGGVARRALGDGLKRVLLGELRYRALAHQVLQHGPHAAGAFGE